MRLKAGDYIYRYQDKLYRVYRYHEYGDLENGDGQKIVGDFWGIADRKIPVTDYEWNEVEEWDKWSTYADLLPTRRKAISELWSLLAPDNETGGN